MINIKIKGKRRKRYEDYEQITEQERRIKEK